MQTEIIAEIDALSVHYTRSARAPDVHARWVADYLDVLGSVRIDILRLACRQWLQGDKDRMPKPGELRTLCGALTPRQTKVVENWTPISEDAYHALSLADKIRHHRIMASECARKAGPMWAGGRPIAEADMPADWRHWRDRRAHHAAEAERLAALLEQHRERQGMAA